MGKKKKGKKRKESPAQRSLTDMTTGERVKQFGRRIAPSVLAALGVVVTATVTAATTAYLESRKTDDVKKQDGQVDAR